jgi:hypothetical protein
LHIVFVVAETAYANILKNWGCIWTIKLLKKQKTRISTGLEAGFWMFQDFLGQVIGGDRWT